MGHIRPTYRVFSSCERLQLSRPAFQQCGLRGIPESTSALPDDGDRGLRGSVLSWHKHTASNQHFPNKRLLVLANDITESATSVVTFGINTDASKSSFTFFSAIGSSASNAGQFAWLAIGY